MLEDILKSYKAEAEVINWKKYNQNELFFEYIKHENEPTAQNYYAGIVCRFWGYSGRIYTQCNKHIPFEQCYDILIDTINYVLNKRVWENPESSLYQDPTGPDKAFHIALKRQRSIVLANLTAYKRKTNFNTLSIDELHEDYNDAAEGLFDIADESGEEDINNSNLISYIKSKEDGLDILLLDQICFNNWTNLKNVVSKISKVNESDFNYYNKLYNLSREDFFKALLEIKNSSSRYILSRLKKVLFLAKGDI